MTDPQRDALVEELIEALRNMTMLADEAVTAREHSDDEEDEEMAPDFRADVTAAEALLRRVGA